MSAFLNRMKISLAISASCLIVSNASAQVRSSNTARRSTPITRGLQAVLGGLSNRSPLRSMPMRPCRPASTTVYTNVYFDQPVSYLSSSVPAYNYSTPMSVSTPIAPYRGFEHSPQGSGITPAREWGGDAPTFFTTRQIAGYGANSTSDGNLVFSSRHPGKPQTAHEDSSAALETARDIGVAMGRGDKAFERGLYDEARAEYARALILSEDDATAKLSMGMAAFAQGAYLDAAEAIHEALQTAPAAVVERFDVRKLFGTEDEFKRHLDKLKLDTQAQAPGAELHLLTGFVHLRSGDRTLAVAELQKIDAQSPWRSSAAKLLSSKR